MSFQYFKIASEQETKHQVIGLYNQKKCLLVEFGGKRKNIVKYLKAFSSVIFLRALYLKWRALKLNSCCHVLMAFKKDLECLTTNPHWLLSSLPPSLPDDLKAVLRVQDVGRERKCERINRVHVKLGNYHFEVVILEQSTDDDD